MGRGDVSQTSPHEHLSEDDARQLTERYSKGQLGRYLINNIKSPNDMSSRIGLIQGNLRKWGRDRNYSEGYGLAHLCCLGANWRSTRV